MTDINANNSMLTPSLARLLINQLASEQGYDSSSYAFQASRTVMQQCEDSGIVKLTIGGVPVECSETVPKGELRLVRDGVVISRVVNIGEPNV